MLLCTSMASCASLTVGKLEGRILKKCSGIFIGNNPYFFL
jgi:hypothetical protein